VHQEELVTGWQGRGRYLLWSDRLPSGPQSITVLEHMTGHPMGPSGRELVAFASQLSAPPTPAGQPRSGDAASGT